MKNPLAALSRLLGRGSSGAVLSALHSHAIGHALLIHGGMGEQLIGAYMSGAIDAPPPITDKPQDTAAGKVAVINISGPLVNRPMPGLCDDGPMSYEAIREAFDQVMSDDNIAAVILRIDSPGGMASGLFDLTDHIYASRGPKPIYAMVDDYAYSAAFAIAAACDQIWVTRTGDGGSVGAVYFFAQVTGADERAGIKITPIYAGERKIDLNPHLPLSPEAQAKAQAEINDLRDLFVASVATYRSLDPEVVRGTEADTYRGQAAVDIGFATNMGTFRDLLATLQAPAPPASSTSTDDGAGDQTNRDATTASATEDHAAVEAARALAEAEKQAAHTLTATRAALADAVAASNLPPAVSLAVLKAKPEAITGGVEAFVASAQTIADLCAAAKLDSLAADFVEQGLAVEVVREKLVDAAASTGTELVTTPPEVTAGQQSTAKPNALDPNRIYESRRK